MSTLVYHESLDIEQRLSALGLSEEPLRDVIRRGYLAFTNCTANHPRAIPGIWAWAETVRALREYVLPMGWRRCEDNNYSTVIAPSGRRAIAVATGDEGTGRIAATPSTKTPKGPSTIDAIECNQLQFAFMEPETPRIADQAASEDEDERVTWILLVHRTGGEVRCELSLPSSIDGEGRINGWRERIVLSPVPLDDDLVDVKHPVQPDIMVDVQRRA